MYRVSNFIRYFAWALLAGTALATITLNLNPAAYYDLIEWRLFSLPDGWLGFSPRFTLISVVSEGLMALFLFFLGKELWEAHVLERGAFRGGRSGAALLATLGGMIGAALVWVILATLFETAEEASFATGWAVPLGSDVVLCYLVGRAVFGVGSQALHVLLLITIGADLGGLLVVGLAYPSAPLQMLWLLLPLLASGAVWLAAGRWAREGATERQHQRAAALWPYLLAGLVSWAGVAASGLPGALGLLPILPAIPHADRAFGLFAEAEAFLHDPLNRFARYLVNPLILILLLFGFTRGGIDLAAWAPTTWITLGALWLGKPLGILAGATLAMRALGMRLPAGVGPREITLIALIGAMGFTVPVLALDTALPGGAMTEAARLGLALSLLAGPLALLIGRVLR